MRPARIARFRRDVFSDAEACCQGGQVSAVITAIHEVCPELNWYAADVDGTGVEPRRAGDPAPVRIGRAAELIRFADSVDQFHSGVFAAVPVACSDPHFREGGLWTEDDEDADLGDAVVEVRAFDTTYILVATTMDAIADHVLTRQFSA